MYITDEDRNRLPFDTDDDRRSLRDKRKLTVWDFSYTKDRINLARVLGAIDQRQGYVEVTGDGVTFANSIAASQSIQITRIKDDGSTPAEDNEFDASMVIKIISLSPVYFGTPPDMSRHVRGQLKRGTVFEAVDQGVKAFPLTLKKLRESGAHASLSTARSGA